MDLKSLEELVEVLKESTMKATEAGERVVKGLISEEVDDKFVLSSKNQKLTKSNADKMRLHTTPGADDRNPGVALTHLLKVTKLLVSKVNELSRVVSDQAKVQQRQEAIIAEQQTAIKEQEARQEVMRKEQGIRYDDLQQRSMKGNIIVSSPEGPGFQSLAYRDRRTDEQGGFRGRESDLDVALRLVEMKTGVKFEKTEVIDCHPIGNAKVGATPASQTAQRFHGYPTTFVLRVGNRRQGSNWDVLQTGILTGRMLGGQGIGRDGFFFSDANVFISNQLTKARADFVKEVVKDARKKRVITNYTVDQNGQVRVKLVGGKGQAWYKVSSK